MAQLELFYISPNQLTIIAAQTLQIKPDRSGSFLPNLTLNVKNSCSGKNYSKEPDYVNRKALALLSKVFNALIPLVDHISIIYFLNWKYFPSTHSFINLTPTTTFFYYTSHSYNIFRQPSFSSLQQLSSTIPLTLTTPFPNHTSNSYNNITLSQYFQYDIPCYYL